MSHSCHTVPSLDSPVEKRGEEKEREVVARVLSRFRPKEVRRREPNQSRRRTKDKTTTGDLMSEKLRLINPYTNEPSSSMKHHQTLPPRFRPSKFEEHAGIKESIDDSKTEMMISKSFPLPITNSISSSSMERNCYSKLLPFPEMFQKLAPAVNIRSVIPVCSAPPPKPNPIKHIT